LWKKSSEERVFASVAVILVGGFKEGLLMRENKSILIFPVYDFSCYRDGMAVIAEDTMADFIPE
jgi:hypothetical protein